MKMRASGNPRPRPIFAPVLKPLLPLPEETLEVVGEGDAIAVMELDVTKDDRTTAGIEVMELVVETTLLVFVLENIVEVKVRVLPGEVLVKLREAVTDEQ